jgi:hypothetical protein
VTGALHGAWNPPLRTYFEYVPIAMVLVGLIWDRQWPRWSGNVRAAGWDVLVVSLAAMRVVVPPLPFVSGPTLLAAYALLTAFHWPLRLVALIASAEIIYTKLFAAGGVASFAGGLIVAWVLAERWRRAIAPM